MELKGLKINFLGDSITEGAGASSPDATYLKLIERTEKAAVCRNYGVGGTRISRQTQPSETERWDHDFIDRAAAMDRDADVVVVFGGTNDFGHGDAKFGTMTDRSVYTFYGAMHMLIRQLLTDFPAATIVFMTPLHRADESAHDGKPELKAYVEAIREVCAYYAVPVLDLYSVSGMQPQFQLIRERYMPDGLHPNDEGQKLIARRLTAFLKAL